MKLGQPRCHVFADGEDFIVFLPDERLLMRTNAAKAREFQACASDKSFAQESGMPPRRLNWAHVDRVVVMCGNQCRLNCRYCLPNHETPLVAPDSSFCGQALRAILERAASSGPLTVGFLGIGEPTVPWQAFTESVCEVEAAASAFCRPLQLTLCTDGQLSASRRRWLCERIHLIDVSLDGPPLIHNRQRPRKDGMDAFTEPAMLIREACAAGRQVRVRTTVTAATVQMMPALVQYFCDLFGNQITIVFAAMTEVGRPGDYCVAPEPHQFAKCFGLALDRGVECGVDVIHPAIGMTALLSDPYDEANRLVCLLPDHTIARHNEPFWSLEARRCKSSVFGRFTDHLELDEDAFFQSLDGMYPPRCRTCACAGGCAGHPSSWGWDPDNPGDADCDIHRHVLAEMLRRLV